jgi:hypothetical protein
VSTAVWDLSPACPDFARSILGQLQIRPDVISHTGWGNDRVHHEYSCKDAIATPNRPANDEMTISRPHIHIRLILFVGNQRFSGLYSKVSMYHVTFIVRSLQGGFISLQLQSTPAT